MSKSLTIKIILLGDNCVGKTSLLKKFCQREIFMGYRATVAGTVEIVDATIDEEKVIVQIWDTAGQERYQSMAATYYRNTNCYGLVFDITDRKSFGNIEEWKKKFIEQVGRDDIPIVVIGTKADLNLETEKRVEMGKISLFCKGHAINGPIPYFETSALKGTNVEQAFKQMISLGYAKLKEEINGNKANVDIYRPTAIRLGKIRDHKKNSERDHNHKDSRESTCYC